MKVDEQTLLDFINDSEKNPVKLLQKYMRRAFEQGAGGAASDAKDAGKSQGEKNIDELQEMLLQEHGGDAAKALESLNSLLQPKKEPPK